jgi:hypothetical protein
MRRSIGFPGFVLLLTLGMISFRKPANSLGVIKTDAGQLSGVLQNGNEIKLNGEVCETGQFFNKPIILTS